MAEKGEDRPKRIKKSAVISYIKTYRDFLKRSNAYCETTLEKLSMHPNSPEPEFFVRDLSEEELSGPRDRIISGWSSLDIQDEEMESHLRDFETEVEDFGSEDSALLKTSPAGPSRLKRLFTSLNKRSRRSASKERAESHVETERRRTVANRLSAFVMKEYEQLKKLKRNIGRALGSRDARRSPRSSAQRTSTPVLDDPIAKEIESMVKDVHILQLGIRILESKLNTFFFYFNEMCDIYTPEAHGMMNDECTERLIVEMQDLLKLKLSEDIMVNIIDVKFKQQPLFLECSEKYEQEVLSKQKTSERVKSMAAGHSSKDESPCKIQRKRLTVDEPPKEFEHSPAKHGRPQESGSTWTEPKVGKLVDIDSPEKKPATGEKSQDESDDEGITKLMRTTSMEDLQ